MESDEERVETLIQEAQNVTTHGGSININAAQVVQIENAEFYGPVQVNQLADTVSDEQIHSFEEQFQGAVLSRTQREIEGGITSDMAGRNLCEPRKEYTPLLSQVDFYAGDWDYEEHLGKEEYRRDDMFITSQEKRKGTWITKEEFASSGRCRKRVIIGQAGSGKTTLMKRLTRDVIAGHLVLTEKDKKGNCVKRNFVHFVNVRDIPVSKKIVPRDLLFGKLMPSLPPEVVKYGFDWLLRNQEKVVFFLDGLDQATWRLPENPPNKMTYADEEDTQTIMYNILSGHLLPQVLLVFSSREHTIAPLTEKLRPGMIAALAGLTLHDRRQLFIQLAGEEGEELWRILCTESPNLVPLLSIPLFNIFTVLVYKRHPENPPDNMTGILVNILRIFMRSEHAQERKIIKKIIKNLKNLAYNGMNEARVIFKLEELEDLQIDFQSLQDFFIQVPGPTIFSQHLMEGDYNLFFCHQAIQELLAAMFIAEMKTGDFVAFLARKAKDKHWSVVFRFLCGILLNQRTNKDATGDLLRVTELTKKQIELKKHLASRRGDNNQLEFYSCLYETNDTDLIQSVVRKNIKLAGQRFVANDIWAISKIIRRCHVVDCLQMAHCDLHHDNLNILKSGLGVFGKITRLNISGNRNLEGAGMGVVGELVKENGVTELIMRNCEITADGLLRFREGVGQSNSGSKLQSLDMSENWAMDDVGMATLGSIVMETGVKEVNLTDCGVKYSGLRRFQEKLGNSKIKKLCFSENEGITDEAAEALGEMVKECEVDILMIQDCSISADGLVQFQKSLEGSKIRRLDVSSRQVRPTSNSASQALVDLIKLNQVKELSMKNWSLTSEQEKILKEAAAEHGAIVDL